MTLLAQNSRSLVWLHECLAAATPRAVAVAAIAIAGGCASAPSSGTLIPVQPSEGARWISAEAIENYGCAAGALACSADGGRLTERQCRCVFAR
jgi:hypothetical protein